MDIWVQVFVIVAAVAILIQNGIMIGIYLLVRDMHGRWMTTLTEVHRKVEPILVRVNGILEDSQIHINNILGDTAEVSALIRNQAVKMNRVITDATGRVRDQVERVDRMVEGAMEALGDAGSRMQRRARLPFMEIAALVKGVKAGLEFMRGRQRGSPMPAAQNDDSLFI
jgi:hypothetical protein